METKNEYNCDVDVNEILKLAQLAYFSGDPLNPKTKEGSYQDILLHLLKENFYHKINSEFSIQKIIELGNGDELSLTNKTERLDLFIPDLSLIFELKWIERITEEEEEQLFNYMKKLNIKYGILINFTTQSKTKKNKEYKAHMKVFENKGINEYKDKYGFSYKYMNKELIFEAHTEDYLKIIKPVIKHKIIDVQI